MASVSSVQDGAPEVVGAFESYLDELEFWLDEFCASECRPPVEDMAKEPQSRWNAALMYIYTNTFGKDKKILKSTKKTKGNMIMQSTCNAYDFNKLNIILDKYFYMCMKNDKECNPIGFSLITGVDYTTVIKWGTGGALSSEGFNLSQKLKAFREESLSSKLPTAGRNAVGILAILNHHFSWNLPGVSKEITAAPKTVADLPTLDGQTPKIEAKTQDIVIEQLPNTT